MIICLRYRINIAIKEAKKKKKELQFLLTLLESENYGVVTFDSNGERQILKRSLKNQKVDMQSQDYIFDSSIVEKAKKVEISNRGELEISSINQMYLNEGELDVSSWRGNSMAIQVRTNHYMKLALL